MTDLTLEPKKVPSITDTTIKDSNLNPNSNLSANLCSNEVVLSQNQDKDNNKKDIAYQNEVCNAQETKSLTLPKPLSFYMDLALNEGLKAWNLEEIPVGAVIVDKDGNVIATGCNRTITDHDPSAHAEIVAIRQAGVAIENYRLCDLSMFVTLEPCCMCSGALVHARFANLIYGAHDYKTGACGSVFNILNSLAHNHKVNIISGIESDRCALLLQEFFKLRRKMHKENISFEKSDRVRALLGL